VERLSCMVFGVGEGGAVRGACEEVLPCLDLVLIPRFLGGESDGSVDDVGF